MLPETSVGLQRAAQAPDRVRVVCNSSMGTFLTQRGQVQMTSGQIVSPTEFERMAGKAASKKWKASIRIDKAPPPPQFLSPSNSHRHWLSNSNQYCAPRSRDQPRLLALKSFLIVRP